MSRIRDIKRELEAAREAIEALDADLAAGKVAGDEHARQRAEHERAIGRLFVSLRRTQGEARERRAEPPPAAERRAGWLGSPLALAGAAVLLMTLGIGGGAIFERWFTRASGGGAPASAPVATPADAPVAGLPLIELEALRQAAAREDAPIPSLLRFAHVMLDQGRLDEARGVYQRVLGREPRNVEAIDHLGAVLYQEGRVDEALAKVEEALRLDPRYVHAHWDRTQYLFNGKRDFPAAIRAAEAFLKIVPEGPDADHVRRLIAEARRQGAR